MSDEASKINKTNFDTAPPVQCAAFYPGEPSYFVILRNLRSDAIMLATSGR